MLRIEFRTVIELTNYTVLQIFVLRGELASVSALYRVAQKEQMNSKQLTLIINRPMLIFITCIFLTNLTCSYSNSKLQLIYLFEIKHRKDGAVLRVGY